MLQVKVGLANDSSCLDLIIFTILGPNGTLKTEMVFSNTRILRPYVIAHMAALNGYSSWPIAICWLVLPLGKPRLLRTFRS